MKPTIVFVLATLTCVFSLVSWSNTAHLIPVYKAISSNWGFDPGYGTASGYVGGFGYGPGPSYGGGFQDGPGSSYGWNSDNGYGSGSILGSGSIALSSSSESAAGYSYSYHGPKGPLAVSAIGMALAILMFLFSPALAFFSWRTIQEAKSTPLWLNRTVLGLSVAGFVVSIAQFGVLGHYNILEGEVAAQAAMFFLATLFGIAAALTPLVPPSWYGRLTHSRSADAEPVPTKKEAQDNVSEA